MLNFIETVMCEIPNILIYIVIVNTDAHLD